MPRVSFHSASFRHCSFYHESSCRPISLCGLRFNKSFPGVGVTNHTIRCFRVCKSTVYSVFTGLCKHHRDWVDNIFIIPRRSPRPMGAATPHFSPVSSPGQPPSTFCLSRSVPFRRVLYMESYDTCSFATGFFPSANVSGVHLPRTSALAAFLVGALRLSATHASALSARPDLPDCPRASPM